MQKRAVTEFRAEALRRQVFPLRLCAFARNLIVIGLFLIAEVAVEGFAGGGQVLHGTPVAQNGVRGFQVEEELEWIGLGQFPGGFGLLPIRP